MGLDRALSRVSGRPRVAALAVLGLCIATVCLFGAARADQEASHDAHAVESVPPDASLKMLQDGNARFVAGKPDHPHQDALRRDSVAGGQKPYAIVLACADSRVAPELVFDAGLGDLFVVRVAGNIADDAVLASVEYAVDHLGATLIVVMGHAQCGAVSATVEAVQNPSPAPGHLGALIDAIKPAVTAQTPGEKLLERAIDANVQNVVTKISADTDIAPSIKAGKVKVVGGRYELGSGQFVLLKPSAPAKP